MECLVKMKNISYTASPYMQVFYIILSFWKCCQYRKIPGKTARNPVSSWLNMWTMLPPLNWNLIQCYHLYLEFMANWCKTVRNSKRFLYSFLQLYVNHISFLYFTYKQFYANYLLFLATDIIMPKLVKFTDISLLPLTFFL